MRIATRPELQSYEEYQIWLANELISTLVLLLDAIGHTETALLAVNHTPIKSMEGFISARDVIKKAEEETFDAFLECTKGQKFPQSELCNWVLNARLNAPREAMDGGDKNIVLLFVIAARAIENACFIAEKMEMAPFVKARLAWISCDHPKTYPA